MPHLCSAPSQRRLAPLVAFLLPAGLFLLVNMFCAIHPFGGRTLLFSDMRNQYVAFLGALQNVGQQGHNLLYSFGITLGGNMFGLITTYLASPLNLLALLFPADGLADAVLLIITLKIGFCGLFMYICLRNFAPLCRPLTLALSTSYALMGYLIFYCYHFMWLDGVALLPLVALGLLRLVRSGAWGLYWGALAAALLTHYYIGYMLCLFSILFFCYTCLLTCPSEKRLAWLGDRALRFALVSLGAGALAAVTLLPSYQVLTSSKAEFNMSWLNLSLNFPPQDLLAKLFSGTATLNDELDYLPNIFCGALVMALSGLYFCNRLLSRKERLASAGLLALLLLSFFIQGPSLVWHAFNVPYSFPYRHSFIFTFVLVLLAARCLAHLKGLTWRHLLGAVVVFGVICVLGVSPSRAALVPRRWRLVDGFCFAGCCLLLWALGQKRWRRPALGLLLALQCAQLLLNGTLTLKQLDLFNGTDWTWQQSQDRLGHTLLTKLTEHDDDFYRLDMPALSGSNNGIMLGYNSVLHFSSVQNTAVLKFLGALGLSTNGTSTIYTTPHAPAAVDSLLGVRYIASHTALPHKQYLPLFETKGVTVFENPQALPLAFAAQSGIMADKLAKQLTMIPHKRLYRTDPFTNTNAVYAAILGEAFGPVFVELAVAEPETEHIVATMLTDKGAMEYRPTELNLETWLPAQPSTLTYRTTAVRQGWVYSNLSPLSAGFLAEMTSGERSLGGFYDYSGNDIFPLQVCRPSEETELTVHLQGSFLRLRWVVMYQEDAAALAEATRSIAAYGADVRKISNSHLAGSVTIPEDRPYLLFTLPYDPGWTVRVDGEKAVPAKALGALLAVEMTPGKHTFDMRYIPAGLVPGAGISAATVLLVLTIVLVNSRKEKKT